MQELIEFLPQVAEQFGAEGSLLFMVVFSLYQMYSPDFLPESKGQKLIRQLLEVLQNLNSMNGSETSTPENTDEGDGNKSDPQTDVVTGSDDVRNGERHG